MLKSLDLDCLPVINTLITIFITLPSSIDSAEKSFSCLCLLKTWLRAKIDKKKLMGLALLHIHKNINMQDNINNIIDKSANGKKKNKIFFFNFIY